MIRILTKEEWFERWEDELLQAYGEKTVGFFKWTDKQYEAWVEAANENNMEEQLMESDQ